MQKRYIVLTALLIGFGAAATACDSDDDIDPTLDASVKPPPDSGGSSSGNTSSSSSSGAPQDSGSDAAQACTNCIESSSVGPGNVCKDNGPPSSEDLVNAIFGCACAPTGCKSACPELCESFSRPSPECNACVQATCGAELQACANEGRPRPDGGPPPDGGTADAGEGG